MSPQSTVNGAAQTGTIPAAFMQTDEEAEPARQTVPSSMDRSVRSESRTSDSHDLVTSSGQVATVSAHAVYQVTLMAVLTFLITLCAAVGYVTYMLGKLPTLSATEVGPGVIVALPLLAIASIIWGIPGMLGRYKKKGVGYWTLCLLISGLFVADIAWIVYRLAAPYLGAVQLP